ncbi:MAG: S26 family signal peptidase [Planctomycetota bacterium]|jgi:signal peptidase I
MPDDPAAHHEPNHSVIESVQSLVVAFVLAMTFRGFVTEGFVIPTGSMAPTLMGQHVLLNSEQTGIEFQVGIDQSGRTPSMGPVPDPMLGRNYPGSAGGSAELRRMGDRILVLKCLYPFTSPDRFDVVVFKNPTDPDGESANYIKRLVGLPDEKVWLLDGDVFAAPNEEGTSLADYRVQRKPEHVQRAVWQPVHDSDYVPARPDRLYPPYAGPPWRGGEWDTTGRVYRCAAAGPAELRWDQRRRPLTDWTIYNDSSSRGNNLVSVSDIRVSAGIQADAPADLKLGLELEVRDHLFQFLVSGNGGDATAEVRMRPLDDPDAWEGSGPQAVRLPGPGQTFGVELWHVDQAMTIFLDGKIVARHEYEWTGRKRLLHFSGLDEGANLNQLPGVKPEAAQMVLRTEGSPLSLHRLAVDRDLYYRSAFLNGKASENPTHPDFEDRVTYGTWAFGTHPEKPAELGPNHYFMLGDNSQASLDSRLWGNPHPLMAEQVDPAPFVVHRQLIVGKAWVVYFPAPYPVGRRGLPIVPDFGRLRFIR